VTGRLALNTAGDVCLGLVVRRWAEPTHEKLLSSIRTVELGFENLGFWGFFTLCSLINKRCVKILIVICEIHQFHLHFSHGVLLLRSLEICL